MFREENKGASSSQESKRDWWNPTLTGVRVTSPWVLPVILVALAVVPALIVGILGRSQTSRLIEQSIGVQLENTAVSSMIYTEDAAINLLRDTVAFGQSTTLRSQDSAAITARLTEQVTAQKGAIDQMVFANREGRLIGAALRPPDSQEPIDPKNFLGLDVSKETWFRKVVAESERDQTAASTLGTVEPRPLVGQINGSGSSPPTPVAAVAVTSPDGKDVVGVVASFPDWSRFTAQLADQVRDTARRSGRTGLNGFLFDSQGRLLADPSGEATLSTRFKDDPAVARIFNTSRNSAGYFKYQDPEDDGGWLAGEVVAGYSRLDRTIGGNRFDWAFLIGQEKDLALKETRGLRTTLLVAVILVLLFSSAIAYLVARALSRRAARLRSTAGEIEQGANTMRDSAAEATGRAERTEGRAQDQSEAMENMRARVEEMRHAVTRIADQAQSVAGKASAAAAAAEEGRRASEAVDRSMADIDERVRGISSEIAALSQQTGQVGEIVATVAGIADQSNLLAFNATIEAAKAGEHGAGFTVIAEEVRTLAEQSKRATAQIKAILSEIDKATANTESSADAGIHSVSEGRERASSAGATIDELAAANLEASKAMEDITEETPRQVEAVDEVLGLTRAASERAREVKQESHQSAAAATELDQLAERLRELAETMAKD